LELKQDKNTKTKFYTNWMQLPVTDYMGADKLEAKEVYNYTEVKDKEGNITVNAYTTTNTNLPKVFFSTEDSSGNIEPIISGISQDQAALTFQIYTRNYEEWVGINKNGDDFYEDFFIGKGTQVKAAYEEYKKKIEESYDNYYTKTEDEVLSEIENIVKTYAAKLWKAAVDDVKSSCDDRPLYWARNKMQVYLKRHPVFKQYIDYVYSTPINDWMEITLSGMEIETTYKDRFNKLSLIIKLFEDLSRNYTGIYFSGAGNKKKILISGYDPFVLNPQKNGNILQANPSGCAALELHGKTVGDYFIQTMIFPVRYKDFDDGYVEDYFSECVSTFDAQRDIIITMSQGSPFRFDVDRFPCKNRGGYMDNMYCGDSAQGYNGVDFKQLSDGKEFYETTLPYKRIVPDKNNPAETFYIYLNQTYGSKQGVGDVLKDIEGTMLRAKLEDIQKLKSLEGSGGDYLSNEIFYRVARMRTDKNRELQTGHLHLPLIQTTQGAKKYFIDENYRNAHLITIPHSHYIKELIDKIEELIKIPNE
jgi:pyrrolidone-carboxylate peptidase